MFDDSVPDCHFFNCQRGQRDKLQCITTMVDEALDPFKIAPT